ncbi:MAG: Outer membrane protein/protective antigen OMA87 [Pseudolabrys sp.]|jgi:hypothetical protein|nr:Outer membrane protein/protective antigen OMA87 [Pseudolabrys sp.]
MRRGREDVSTVARARSPAVSRAVRALVACGIVAGAWPVLAQTAPATQTARNSAQDTPYDPFTPLAAQRAKKKPPAYETFQPGSTTRKPSDEPATFQLQQLPLPPSGIGTTGFDATNARKRQKTPAKTQASNLPSLDGGPSLSGLSSLSRGAGVSNTQPQSVVPNRTSASLASNSQTPASATAANSYAYGPPGQPPIAIGSPPPLRKKKKKVAEADPYEPLGIRSGGMIYYPAIELTGGYDSNPARTNGGAGAGVLSISPELRAQSDWERHEFKANLRGSYNFYSPDPTPSLNRPYFQGDMDGRIDVTHDTRIDLNAHTLVSTDNPNSPNLPAGLSELPIYTSFGGTAGIGQKFNRLDLSIKGTADRTQYQDSKLTNGTTASNEDRNYNQYGVVLRGSYELSPSVKPFVEVSADTRKHDLAVDSSGYRRDSNGWTGMVGSTFELTRMLTGEIAIGYTHREYDDPRLNVVNAPVARASLTWQATPLTTVKLSGTSTVGEVNVPGVSSELSRDAGIEVDHAFRRWLIGTLKGGIGQDDYVGGNRIDNRYYFGVAALYKLNRFVQLKGEARHEWLVSTQAINNYAANVFLMGLRLQY